MNPNYSQGNNDMEVGLKVATEWDELWPCAGSNADQRWAWYLINRTNGDIVAWENGRRTDRVFKKPPNSVKDIPIKICRTDNLGHALNYSRKIICISLEKTIRGK